ncbi:hypothetical protein GALMADRAFT_69361 [Galerina marginata CBS 339.88]|uniref:Uncharacterized protein n=1 Tax=Galerina marginata (strain CBS 339.88) TaxID=685588 RepID=A0A067T7Y9_GALM3|nr:hypothetical protein GALMADRAFT_69361 [Galerina marginata CBS 339.88]
MSLPRVNSRTPLHQDHRESSFSPPMSLSLHVAQLAAAFHPRKPKQRTTFAALLILLCLTGYIFIAQSTYMSPSLALRRSDSAAADQLALALETIQNSRLSDVSNKHGLKKGHHPVKLPLKLDAGEELAAVTSFLASLPQNVIPPTVDPSLPIDPQLVLDFDTRGSRARDEVKAIVEDVWTRNPVFLYSKLYSPASRELKSILSGLHLRPAPTIIDVDVRDDAEILMPMLSRLTSSPELPLLIIGGKPILSSVSKIRALEKSGELQKMITSAGSIVNGAKKKKGRK